MRRFWESALYYGLLVFLVLMFLATVKFATMIRPF